MKINNSTCTKLANQLFELSRDCPKEFEGVFLAAVAALYNMKDRTHD